MERFNRMELSRASKFYSSPIYKTVHAKIYEQSVYRDIGSGV